MQRLAAQLTEQQVYSQVMMAAITEQGQRTPTEMELLSVKAIAEQIFDYILLHDEVEPSIPGNLETTVSAQSQKELLMAMLMCLALVGGKPQPGVIAVLDVVAVRLRISLSQRDLLDYALKGQNRRFLWRVTRNAAIDYWAEGGTPSLRDWAQIARQAFIPNLLTNKRTASRYQELDSYPEESLGRYLYNFYRSQGWALPGEPEGFPERFVVHECTHLLTDYGTHPHGEMLAAVFTGGAKRRNAIDWLLVPLMQWHLKEPVVSLSARHAYRDLLEPRKYFHAMRRGMDSQVSLMDDGWSFWEHAEQSVVELRERYNILPAAPDLVDSRRWSERHATV